MTEITTPTPPLAAKKTKTLQYPGGEYQDDYAWLRDREDPDLIPWLEAENAHTEAWLADTADLREKLYREMRARITEDDSSVPVRKGEYWYYHRMNQGQEYPLHCRRKGSMDNPEEILLDVNILAAGKSYFKLATFSISPDHRILAWSSDENGDEKYTLHFRDLQRGEEQIDVIQDVTYGAAWSADSRTFFYVVMDEIDRPYRVMAHSLETDPAEDRIVYEETDKAFFVNLDEGLDGVYNFIVMHTHDTSEVRCFKADDSQCEVKVLRPRKSGVIYQAAHRNGWFYILTNENALNFKLIRQTLDKSETTPDQTVLQHDPQINQQYFVAFKDWLAVKCRVDGKPTLRIIAPESGRIHDVAFPEDACELEIGENAEFDSGSVRIVYQSFVTPRTVYELNMNTQDLNPLKMQQVPGYNPNLYENRRVMVPSKDGTLVPLILVYRKGMILDGNNPCFLTGYGAYGICNDPEFKPQIFSLLDRGFIWALAQIRGGGEMGRKWYEDGKRMKKKNTFLDFIACAEYLIEQKWTSAEKLVIHGRSAGGLLIGAVVTMRPELFRAAIPGVPFVDALNTMMDPSLPLTVIEYAEWGDPNQLKIFNYMRSYSPYDNVKATDYPAMLFQGGLNDPRVGFWEPAKMVARLREMKTNDEILLLHTKMGEGHSAGAARFEKFHDIAYRFAFSLKIVGITQ